MKKIMFILLMLFPMFIYAKEIVAFDSCTDGDTFRVTINGESEKIRMLAIDTPETKSTKVGVEYYGKEASDYTCSMIENAKIIELEYDDNSDKTDKYDRILAWVFIDGELLQDKLVRSGYAEVAYLYGDYKYTNILKDSEIDAKKEQLGIWNNYKDTEPSIYIVIALVLLSMLYTYIKKRLKKRFKGSKIKLDLFKE